MLTDTVTNDSVPVSYHQIYCMFDAYSVENSAHVIVQRLGFIRHTCAINSHVLPARSINSNIKSPLSEKIYVPVQSLLRMIIGSENPVKIASTDHVVAFPDVGI